MAPQVRDMLCKLSTEEKEMQYKYRRVFKGSGFKKIVTGPLSAWAMLFLWFVASRCFREYIPAVIRLINSGERKQAEAEMSREKRAMKTRFRYCGHEYLTERTY